MDGPELHYIFGTHGLDGHGRLFDCLYDGHWLLVRELHPEQFASIKAACDHSPEQAAQLLTWLDPRERAREPLAEDRAWDLVARMRG
jgi:hypothetical protein